MQGPLLMLAALGLFALHAMGVRVVSIRPGQAAARPAQDADVLHGGDTLVLSGRPAAIALAEEKLMKGA